MASMIRTCPKYWATLSTLDFPFEGRVHADPGQLSGPDGYVPQRTILRVGDDFSIHAYLWCYVRRKASVGGWEFDPESISAVRVGALGQAVQRLSDWARFRRSSPATINFDLSRFGQFLSWVDSAENAGRFEAVMNDPDVALDALRKHHTYLRQLVQNRAMRPSTAAFLDQRAVRVMSEIHARTYADDFEPLRQRRGRGSIAPEAEVVRDFLSTLEAVFDAAARLLLHPGGDGVVRGLPADDRCVVDLADQLSRIEVIDLACVTFAGIAIADSGANLAQIRTFKVPDDLLEQLAKPARVGLQYQEIKPRAGGKCVPVHFSATTLSRMRAYLQLREMLLLAFDRAETVKTLFVQCEYARGAIRAPKDARDLDRAFLLALRRRVRVAMGYDLPDVHFRQLRAFKQVHLSRRNSVHVSAAVMGHSLETALKAYNNAQESVRREEMGTFLRSLSLTVVEAARGHPNAPVTTDIAAGSCASYGAPRAKEEKPIVEPDCRRSEGCLFCHQYRVHADEQDLRKLLSCRSVVRHLAPLQGSANVAGRAFGVVVDRIDALLREIEVCVPHVYRTVEVDVNENGNLTDYWLGKLAQLRMLGLLSEADAS